ncbi:MAG: ATP--guanido phosphotransferase, partial [Verrucomicrobia bacterium]|nr:ATP--guanido phosphotransferase [Verrucomicrobiota bacterium]
FIRLGVDLGMFPNSDREIVNELFLVTQKGHLQMMKGTMEDRKRDQVRAEILREKTALLGAPRKVEIVSKGGKK